MMRNFRRIRQSSVLAGFGLLLASSLFGQVNLYVPNYDNTPPDLSEFTINTGTGALTPVVGQATTTTDNNPWRVAMTPNNQFLYVSNGNGYVDGFSVSPTGFLTPLTPAHYAVPGSFGIVANNNYLYVTTAGTGNSVAVFSIAGNGTLTGPLTCAACSTGVGSNPRNIVLDPSNAHVYVGLGATNQIWVGTIVPSGAGAGTIGSSTVAYTGPGTFTPEDLAITPNGLYLYASNFTGNATVTAFTVSGTTVTLVNNYATDLLPNGLAIDPSGKYLYVATLIGMVDQFTVGAGGVLTPIGSGSIAAGSQPTGATVEPTGHYLYVSNYADNTVGSYSIGGTGALTSVNTVAAGTGPYYLLAHLVPSATVPASSGWSLAALGLLLAGLSGLLYRKAYR